MKYKKSNHYSKCVRAKRSEGSCDAVDILITTQDFEVPRSSNQEAVNKQIARVNKEEAKVLSKLLYLNKHKAFLRGKKVQIIQRGLRYLDELDAEEEKEKKKREAQEQQALINTLSVSNDPAFQVSKEN